MVARLLAVSLVLALGPGDNTLRAEVRPSAVLVGGSVTVVCWVPRKPGKRWLEIGVEQVHLSGHQLDEESTSLWLQDVKNIPCEAGRAYCAVGVGKDPDDRAFAQLEVGGCRGH